MPFINLENNRNALWNTLWNTLFNDSLNEFGVWLIVLVGVVAICLMCDNVDCAIMIVWTLTGVFCLIWTIVVWCMVLIQIKRHVNIIKSNMLVIIN